MYSYTNRIRYSECNKDLQLSIRGLVNYFQDTSTFQSEDLGVGIEFLSELGCAWVLSYWHIEIQRMPQLGEEVVVTTWPYDFNGFTGSRNFIMKTQAGEVLANANSLWTYVDMVNQRIKKVDPHQLMRYQLSDPYDMPKISRKIAVPDKLDELKAFQVEHNHLDSNNHVNNEKYISLALEHLPVDTTIRNIRVEYKQSAVLEDTICPKLANHEDKYVVVLDSQGNKPYAVVEFS